MNKQTIITSLNHKAFYSSELPSIKWNGSGMGQGLCPFHDDKRPSLSVSLSNGSFKCFGCNKSGSIFDFYMAKHSVDYQTAFNALAKEAGLNAEPQRILDKTYDYTDESGKLLFQAIRYEPKGFSQRRPDGKGGWIYNLNGVQIIPYNLPTVLKAKSIIIVEGEKDADNLKVIGLTATCNPMGAGKWRKDYNKYFKDKKVTIIPDNDEPGRKHADTVANNLKGIAESVRVLKLLGLPDKGDISDWIGQGGTKERLIELIKQPPEWRPDKTLHQTGMPLIRLGDLLKEPEVSVAWLVEGILPSGGFSVLASKPKVGKSTLARNLALCTAQGEPFFNREVNKGPVIYYALEEKRSEVKRHFKDLGSTGEEDIFIYTGGTPVDAIKQIREVAETLKPGLIIIDPLFRLTRIKDGNDYAQVTLALEPLLRLARDTESHVLCVHHTNKGQQQGGDSVLGSTAIFSSVDTLMIMKRHENYRTVQTIQRYGEDLEETTLHFDKDVRFISIGKAKQEEDISIFGDAIVEFLSSQNDPVIESEIMDGVEGRTGVKRKALREFVNDGKITREGKGGKGDPFRYSCSLVPIYSVEQENENPEKHLTSYNHNENTRSQDSSKCNKSEMLREQAFCATGIKIEKEKCEPCGRNEGCMMTEGQKQHCKGPFQGVTKTGNQLRENISG